MEALDRLLAIEAIKTLKARYFRLVDTKDWNGFRTLFSKQVEFDLTDSGYGILTDIDAILARVRDSFAGCVSVHHGYMPEIEILADDRATGIWAMEDVLYWMRNSSASDTSLHGYGHYFESYEKIGGVWHIRTVKLKRLRVDRTSRALF